ncbi:MAG: hypothetical protein PVI90_00195 [Desulfobacteraceae bacterium]|jgi:hypothetical protein
MDPIIALLLKNGAFGILAGIGFYLYLKERKINQEYAETFLKHLVSDAVAKTKLTNALEDLATTIETVEKHTKTRLKIMQTYMDEQRLKAAREEGRREAHTNTPSGGSDD